MKDSVCLYTANDCRVANGGCSKHASCDDFGKQPLHCGPGIQSINQSISQSKHVTPRRRWCTQTDASAMMAAHRRLSSATRSNGDIDRLLVHSLMLSFHDLRSLPLRRLPSMEPCSMIFGSVLWRQTWLNHDNSRRLTVDSRSS